ncbi:MAG: hypothetical protein HY728_03970 [Candidatus Rokubacteria bacterium]|nr:hypothetical protein [Candidatus Rokubacteria bacterium]MBI4593348.1 hypothetical protein [Candidatus Rokubacteria bacterium]
MTGRSLLTLSLILVPEAAWACASCISSAYGDRTYNWAFLGLVLTPFLVAAGIGGVLAYVAWQRRSDRQRSNLILEETT